MVEFDIKQTLVQLFTSIWAEYVDYTQILPKRALHWSLIKLIGIIPKKFLMVYLYALFIAEIIDWSLKISYLATIKHKGRF